MANYIPTLISPDDLPFVSITMANGYSYTSFVASMTSIFYMILGIKIYGNTQDTVQNNYSFTLYNYTGTTKEDVNPFLKDPYQIQNEVEKFFTGKQYILNGMLTMQFIMNPMQNINIYLDCIEFNPSDLLNNLFMKGRGYVFINEVQEYLSDFKEALDEIE